MTKAKIEYKNDTRPITEYKIDLGRTNQPEQLVKKGCVEISKRFFMFGMLGKSPKFDYKLCIKWEADERLVTNPSSPLFILTYEDKKNDVININARQNKLNFQIFLDPNQILDCTEKENHVQESYKIAFEVFLVEESNIIASRKGEISVVLSRPEYKKPIITFEPNEKGRELVYCIHDEKPYTIGDLVIKNASNFLYSASCDIDFTIVAKAKKENQTLHQVDDLITLGSEIRQTNPRITISEEQTGIAPENVDASNFISQVNSTRAVLRNIDVNKGNGSTNINEVRIPLYWDMQKATNPQDEKQEYVIFIEAKTASSIARARVISVFYDHLYITLKRNQTLMDLGVKFGDSVTMLPLYNHTTSRRYEPLLISGGKTEYSLQLKNTAEYADQGKEGARIYIKNFYFKLPVPAACGILENSGVGQARLFEYTTEMANGSNFALGIKQQQTFKFSYDHTCITKMMDDNGREIYEREIKVNISFEYYVDKENAYNHEREIPESDFCKFDARIPILAKKEPKPEWLCVDFGSSAIVASYGSHRHDKKAGLADNLLTLGTAKNRLLKKWFKSDSQKSTDKSEQDPRLITSAVVVNLMTNNLSDTEVKKAKVSALEYLQHPIQLSPSSGMIDIYTRILPGLKSIMGNNIIPENILPANVRMSETDPLKVNTVFESVYRQLFNLFLPSETRKTNKIVMTIPNTYAPNHVDILRGIVSDLLPEVRSDYTYFISESDAVAFYYLSRRPEFKEHTQFSLDPNFDKRVLVYDMGAGTLDLTYFTRTEQAENEIIEVVGKMGVSSAGNYIDYLIAEIIVDLLAKDDSVNDRTQKELQKILSLSDCPGRDSDAASCLKHFVRDEVKPQLNYLSSTIPTLKLFNNELPTKKITAAEIVEHEKFQTYLKMVSEQIFQEFKSLFERKPQEIRPDLVIFSGRATHLNAIREAVRNALTVFGCSEECMFADLSGEQYSKDVSLTEGNISSLKTAVVDGALAFCSDFAAGKGKYILKNKNVYAQYGIIFRQADGWVWEKLIDTHTQPCNDENTARFSAGMTIYEYDSRVHDASNISSFGQMEGSACKHKRNFADISGAYVIQSYSNHTQNDWPKNKDLISIIGYADLQNISGVLEYGLRIDDQNQIRLMIGASEMTLQAHDEIDSTSFRKSMWPIVR